jgi:riboflavin biosynthesis pyrimidine reductase
MRALLPEPGYPDVDVHEYYARDWLDRGGLRINFVGSVDGAATADGVSAPLQTPGDNRVFAALRDLADVVVVGAGTARIEGYAAIELSERRRAIRRRYGLPEALPTAVISRSLHLDPASKLFTAAPANAQTILITSEDADRARRAQFDAVADVVVCAGERAHPLAMRRALEERGLRRILCEGGPTVFSELAEARAADELCLSISPLLVGPGTRRLIAGQPWHNPDPLRLQLVGLLEEDGALFCRYLLSDTGH